MSKSNYSEDQLQDALWNHETTGLPSADNYIQLHNGSPGEDGTTNVVAVARVQVNMGVSSSGSLTNSADLDIPGMPTDDVVGWSAWDAAGSGSPPTGGNCLETGWLSTISGLGIVRSGDLASNDIQGVAHGLVANDLVIFEQVEGLTVPTGLTAGTFFYVIATGLTTDAYRVSTSVGGSAVDITAVGSAVWRKIVKVPTSSGETFRFQAGKLTSVLD